MVMILKACQGSLEAQFQGLEFVLQPALAMDVSGGKVTAADELAIVTEARSAVEKVRGDWIAALDALGSATSSLWAAKFVAPHIHRDELQSMHNMLHDATGASFVRVLDAVADACALSCCSPGGADLSEGEQKSYSELITTCCHQHETIGSRVAARRCQENGRGYSGKPVVGRPAGRPLH